MRAAMRVRRAIARQILLATPPNDPNQLGLAILELLLLTEGVSC